MALGITNYETRPRAHAALGGRAGDVVGRTRGEELLMAAHIAAGEIIHDRHPCSGASRSGAWISPLGG